MKRIINILILTIIPLTIGQKLEKKNDFNSNLVINIMTMGEVSDYKVNLIKSGLIDFYNYEIRVLPKIEIFSDTKVPGTSKFNADKILNDIIKKFPKEKGKILVITNVDISTSRELNGKIYKNWGILGIAKLNGRPSLVSTHRIKNKEKLIKVAIHEVGHSLGIPHCNDINCIMTDAKGKSSTFDRVKIWMCGNCKSKIKTKT